MKIFNNVVVTGSISSTDVSRFKYNTLIPLDFSGSGSFLTESISGSNSIGMVAFTDDNGVTNVFQYEVRSASGSLGKILVEKSDPTLNKTRLQQLINCLVQNSQTNAGFTLNGDAADTSGPYNGLDRSSWYSPIGGSTGDVAIVVSKVDKADNGVFLPDFTLMIGRGGIVVSITDKSVEIPNIEDTVARFKNLICKCLQIGESIKMYFEVTSAEGTFKFEVEISDFCGDKPKITKDITFSKKSIVAIPGTGSIDGNVDFTATGDIEIGYITGSATGSTNLTASVYNYMGVPHGTVGPTAYYPFNGALENSFIKEQPGLLYFNTDDSSLYVYDGNGNWANVATATGSSGTFTRFTELVGNATASMFVITHSKNTRDVVVSVRQTASPYEFVFPTIKAVDENSVSLDFSPTIPSSGEYTAIII